MKLGFSGTQSGMNYFQKEKLVEFFNHYNPDELHHGDCIGSDSQCHYEFLRWHCANDAKERKIVIHPANNPHKRAFTADFDRYSPALKEALRNCKYKILIEQLPEMGYHSRNQEIVLASEVLVATPKEMEHSFRGGTWFTIRFAWHRKVPVHVIPPLVQE